MVTCVTSKLARIAAISTVPVVAFALASCSSTSGTSNGTNTASASASSSASAELKTTNLQASEVQVSGGGATQPTASFPTPSSASVLSTVDTKEGTGKAAKATDVVEMNYVGIGALTGKEFDSSWAAGQPLNYPLANLIPGWQQGIPGMKPGGQRVLVIPGDLAYGPKPGTPEILPNETLVFVVELISAKSAS